MARFDYQACTSKGNFSEGTIEAPNIKVARAILTGPDVELLSLKEHFYSEDFYYVAQTPTGARVTGRLEADDEDEARATLNAWGLETLFISTSTPRRASINSFLVFLFSVGAFFAIVGIAPFFFASFNCHPDQPLTFRVCVPFVALPSGLRS